MAKLTVRNFTDLDAARAEYINKVDIAAGVERSFYVTEIPGQTMTYDAKLQEANRFPDGPHPFLTAEASALGLTVQNVATTVLASREKWEAVGVEIEAARVAAKAAIRSATTAAEMHRIAENWRSGSAHEITTKA